MGARAGMISAVNQRKRDERKAKNQNRNVPRNHAEVQQRKESKMLYKYGLEKVDKDDLENMDPLALRALYDNRPQTVLNDKNRNKLPALPGRQQEDGFYNHHAEILAEKRNMELAERAAELNALGFAADDPEGLAKLEEAE